MVSHCEINRWRIARLTAGAEADNGTLVHGLWSHTKFRRTLKRGRPNGFEAYTAFSRLCANSATIGGKPRAKRNIDRWAKCQVRAESRSSCVRICPNEYGFLRTARRVDPFNGLCSHEQMGANQLRDALRKLSEAIRETETVLESMRSEHDPLAVHIFTSRRQYRQIADTKSGKRREVSARLSWRTACDLGFRGSLREWERLLGS